MSFQLAGDGEEEGQVAEMERMAADVRYLAALPLPCKGISIELWHSFHLSQLPVALKPLKTILTHLCA